MKPQNAANHAQYVPGYHGLTAIAILALLIGSIVNLSHALQDDGNLYSASLITLIAVILCLMFWYTRSFPLRAQDRAIRAEENLRHFVLTGKPLDNRLRMSQIIALRFASDAEFPALAAKAAETGMPAKDIKQAIAQWRPDYYRV